MYREGLQCSCSAGVEVALGYLANLAVKLVSLLHPLPHRPGGITSSLHHHYITINIVNLIIHVRIYMYMYM